jgi:hypothetical protein
LLEPTSVRKGLQEKQGKRSEIRRISLMCYSDRDNC